MQFDDFTTRNLRSRTAVTEPQWRGILLTAAKELREGVVPIGFATASPDSILAMPIDILFDFISVHIDGPKAENVDLRIDLNFTDQDQTWSMWVKRGVLNARQGDSPGSQLTITGPKAALVGVLLQPAAASKLAQAGTIRLDGDSTVLDTFAGVLDEFDPNFAIVTP